MTTATRTPQPRGKLEVDDLGVGNASADVPLDPDTLRYLRYMHDVESHTVCYLRDILVTKAHADPLLTEFLTTWAYEEHWHGEALGQVLKAHSQRRVRSALRTSAPAEPEQTAYGPSGSRSAQPSCPTSPPHSWRGGRSTSGRPSWQPAPGHQSRAPRPDSTPPSDLRQEGRHIDFYAREAQRRLDRSRASQIVTRFVLKRLWSPLGTGVRPAAEVRFVVRHLFDGTAGEASATRIDRRVDRLPDLARLNSSQTPAPAASPPSGRERVEQVALHCEHRGKP